MFSKLMKKTVAVAAIAAMTSAMAATATSWWSINFDNYVQDAAVTATTETQGTWTQAEDDQSVVTSNSLSLNTQGEDLTWTPNEPAESYDSAILDADVTFVASDVEPTVDATMQTAIYLKAVDDGTVLCAYMGTENGAAWEELDGFAINDGDTKHVTITVDYSESTPMVTLKIGETTEEYPIACKATKVSSVSFRGTGTIDNFAAQTSVNVTYVASVGEQQFETYAAAFAYAAANGGALTITGDSAEELKFGTFTFTKDATIDLNGKSIEAAFVVDGGAQFSVANGTVTAPAGSDTIYIIDGKATVAATATINASDNCAVFIKNTTDATAQLELDVHGTLASANSPYATIQGNGLNVAASVINIFDKASVTHDTNMAIYHPQAGTLTIGAATVTGTTGIEMRAGTLVVNGATITATGTFSAEPNNDGSTVNGAAIALSQHTTAQPTTVTVNSGTLNGQYAFYQCNVASGTSESVAATIAAGTTVNGAVATAETGFVMPEAADGSYTLAAAAATIGDASYETVAEAFDAAVDGDTVVILAASFEPTTITSDITIDLNGAEVTGAVVVDGGAQVTVANGTLTAPAGSDTIDIKNGKATVAANAKINASDNCAVFIRNKTDANAQLALDVYGTLASANSPYATIQGNGLNVAASEINIFDGASVTHATNMAIYHPQNGDITIGAATVTGTTGIEMRAGTLVVDGATITATGKFSAGANNDGSTVEGAAIALSQHTTAQPTTVTVNSGTLVGEYAFYQCNVASGTSESVAATIAAGTTIDGAVATAEDGFVMVGSDETGYALTTAAATIGDASYVTVAEAFAAAVDGDTVVILAASFEPTTITSDITIDLNGAEVTGAVVVDGGAQVTVANGTLTAPDGSDTIYIKNGKATVAANATINASDNCAVFIKNTTDANATLALDVYGTLYTADSQYATIQGNGLNVVASTINIYDGASVTHDTDMAIYHPQEGTLKIGAATITGTTGIEMRAGTLVVDGATITATGTFSAGANNDGSTVEGAAIALSQHTTQKKTSVTVNSGSLTGDVAFYAAGDAEDIYATIAAGVLADDAEIVVADGFVMPKAEDGSYTLAVEAAEFAPVAVVAIAIEGDEAKLTIEGDYSEVKVYFCETLGAEWGEPTVYTLDNGVVTVPATTATGFFKVEAR